jgi:penicillin-binding protein 1B
VTPELAIPRAPVRKASVVKLGLAEKIRSMRGGRACCLVLLTLVTIVSVSAAIFIYDKYQGFAELIDQQIAGGYLKGHSGLYAAPRVIEVGARLSKEQLVESLQRAGYARNAASNIWSGSFEVDGNQIRIMPRRESETHEWIDVAFNNNGTVTSLSTNDTGNLRSYPLEPELLTVDSRLKTGEQQTVTFPEIPPVLIQAILAIEDRRFFQHSGLDIRGISRAAISWSTSGSIKFHQGGSTITQQLVKNTYLTPEKTLRRKFNEAMIALALEQRLSKQDIFALYCNEVYLGQRNGVGVRGVTQAARVFFGKELKDLSLAEAATIAGMIQSPARYAPDSHPETAKSRRDQVIAAMVRDGSVDSETAQRESASPLSVAVFESSANEFAPYYIDAVNREIENAQVSVNPESGESSRVQTTIDPDLQAAAEHALRHQLDLLGKSRQGKAQPQGALVALDVHTGNVLAMVGGRNYAESQLNRATDARRQPGSVFKPFVYAAAFESGISPLSLSRDAPLTFEYGTATYSPANYGKAYSMHDVLLREGLVRSLNVVTVDLALRTGLYKVAETASDFGLPRPDAFPSMALGAFEATPLQIAAAYAAFANGGHVTQPAFYVDSVNSEQGLPEPEKRQVIKATTAYMITDVLSDVIKRGTARGAKASFSKVAIAGKTGTSRDGWFVGYTPNLVCVVWVGFDDNEQLGMTGAESALPAWVDFMKEALAIRPSLGGASFPKPSGIVTVKVDPESGELAGPGCPSSQIVDVAYRFAPGIECYMHLPPTEPEMETNLEEESSFGASATNNEVNSEEVSEPDLSSDQPLEPPSEADKPTRDSSGPQSKTTRRTTQAEVNDRGETTLVSDPAVLSRTNSSRTPAARKSGSPPR